MIDRYRMVLHGKQHERSVAGGSAVYRIEPQLRAYGAPVFHFRLIERYRIGPTFSTRST